MQLIDEESELNQISGGTIQYLAKSQLEAMCLESVFIGALIGATLSFTTAAFQSIIPAHFIIKPISFCAGVAGAYYGGTMAYSHTDKCYLEEGIYNVI